MAIILTLTMFAIFLSLQYLRKRRDSRELKVKSSHFTRTIRKRRQQSKSFRSPAST